MIENQIDEIGFQGMYQGKYAENFVMYSVLPDRALDNAIIC